MKGAALFIKEESAVTLLRVTIKDNLAKYGAGVFKSSSNTYFYGVIFANNVDDGGGQDDLHGEIPTCYSSCTAGTFGVLIGYADPEGNPPISNCPIFGSCQSW
jgi:hypothetical protein